MAGLSDYQKKLKKLEAYKRATAEMLRLYVESKPLWQLKAPWLKEIT